MRGTSRRLRSQPQTMMAWRTGGRRASRCPQAISTTATAAPRSTTVQGRGGSPPPNVIRGEPHNTQRGQADSIQVTPSMMSAMCVARSPQVPTGAGGNLRARYRRRLPPRLTHARTRGRRVPGQLAGGRRSRVRWRWRWSVRTAGGSVLARERRRVPPVGAGRGGGDAVLTLELLRDGVLHDAATGEGAEFQVGGQAPEPVQGPCGQR